MNKMYNNNHCLATAAVLLVLAVLITGCRPTPTPLAISSAIASPTNTPDAGGLIVLNPEQSLRFDAEAYAKRYGVSVDEAIRRLREQDEIGQLNANLQANEADTFGGLWIEHEPTFKVVTLFTRDGKKTLRPYLAGKDFASLVEVRPARFTLAELQSIYAQTVKELAKLDFQVNTALNVQGNRVEIDVADADWVQSELQRVGSKLPQGAVLVTVPGGSTAKNMDLLLTPPVHGIAFPRQKPVEGIRMCQLLEMTGTLRLENGCLYVYPIGSDRKVLVIWPSGVSLRLAGDQAQVIDGQGRMIVQTGDEVYLAGGGTSDDWVLQQIPPACRGDTFIAECGIRPNLRRNSELFALDVLTDTVLTDTLRTRLFLRYKPALDLQVSEPATLSGKLVVDNQRRCPYLQTDWGTTTLIWPLDWTAGRESGEVVIRDAAGQVMARTGAEVQLRGRSIPHSADVPVYAQLIDELPADCVGATALVDGK